MSTGFSLTDTEWKVMSETRRLLGPSLANYLLSGIREFGPVHCRAFTAVSDSSQAHAITYRFETRDESERVGLPTERDPLVLAVLIEILRERQPLNSRISFRDGDLLVRLRWPDTQESQARIKQALERYSLTAYYLVVPGLSADERADGRYAGAKRLVIGYETSAVRLPVRRTAEQGLTSVQFLPDLGYDVLLSSRRFLGIDFKELRGVQEVTCRDHREGI
jgi:hypothetical protein